MQRATSTARILALAITAAACRGPAREGVAPGARQGGAAAATERPAAGDEVRSADAGEAIGAGSAGAGEAGGTRGAGETGGAGEAGAASAERSEPSAAALRREAHRVVDDWHAAAAVGDAPRYTAHLAPDVVFLGTDSSERWDFATFRAYIDRHFANGRGWTYVPSERGLAIDEGSGVAWFDERLTSVGYGELRGTGVLRRDGDTWRIVHYSMTFTIPNEVASRVVEIVRSR